MRTNTVTGVIFGLFLMVFAEPSQAQNIPNAESCPTWDCEIENQLCLKADGANHSGDYICTNKKWVLISNDDKEIPNAESCPTWDCEIENQLCLKADGANHSGDYICTNKKWVKLDDETTGGDGGVTASGNEDNQEELNRLRNELEQVRSDKEEELNNLRNELEAKAGLEEELNNLRNELEAKAGLEEELNNLKGELEAKAGLEEELNNLRRKIMRGVDRAPAPMQRDNTDWYQYNKCRKINNNSEECDRFLDDGGRAQMEGSDKWYKINKSRAEKKQKRAECERVLYDGLLSNKIKECNALGYERQFDGNVKYQEPQ